MATKRVDFWNNRLDGGADDDVLLGDWRDNTILGADGEDRIFGDGGNDILGGGDDGDELYGEGGDDRLSGDRGDDWLVGGSGNDALFGGDGFDTLQGGSGDDELSGDAGNDTIIDTVGVDQIEGGSGHDLIEVQGGDTFRFDTVSGGSGNDDITARGSKVLVSAGSGDDTITSDLHGDKVLSGGAGNDRIVINNPAVSAGRVMDILGGDGAVERSTNIFGYQSINSVTPGTDTGIDTLDLSEIFTFVDASVLDPDVVSKFFVDLGAGIMTNVRSPLDFGSSLEEYLGADLASSEVTVPRENVVATISGVENVVGTDGGDGIIGNAAANDLRGELGLDYINGGAGNDTIDGGFGSDVLVGGEGADTILGGFGFDKILGDAVGDGVFADTLTGGSGADTFVFADVGKTQVLASAPASGGGTPSSGGLGNPLGGLGSAPTGYAFVDVSVFDTITDFDTTGTDRDAIDLSLILDAKSNFGGTTAQQAIDQGYIYFVQHGTQGQPGFGTQVMVDLNGGAHTDAANNFAVADLLGVRAADLASQHLIV